MAKFDNTEQEICSVVYTKIFKPSRGSFALVFARNILCRRISNLVQTFIWESWH